MLRRLIILKVLTEDTRRQDNQYGNVVSQLRVDEVLAGELERGQMKVMLPFLAAATVSGGEKAAKKAGKSCQRLLNAVAACSCVHQSQGCIRPSKSLLCISQMMPESWARLYLRALWRAGGIPGIRRKAVHNKYSLMHACGFTALQRAENAKHLRRL